MSADLGETEQQRLVRRGEKSQSLLHQGMSADSANIATITDYTQLSQSLLHQGMSADTVNIVSSPKVEVLNSLNPFFTRG